MAIEPNMDDRNGPDVGPLTPGVPQVTLDVPQVGDNDLPEGMAIHDSEGNKIGEIRHLKEHVVSRMMQEAPLIRELKQPMQPMSENDAISGEAQADLQAARAAYNNQ